MGTLVYVARPDAERSLAFGSISSTFAAIGAALSFAASHIVLQNLTDVSLSFSIDSGTATYITLSAGASYTIDLTANHMEIKQGNTIQVKDTGSGAASGSARVSILSRS